MCETGRCKHHSSRATHNVELLALESWELFHEEHRSQLLHANFGSWQNDGPSEVRSITDRAEWFATTPHVSMASTSRVRCATLEVQSNAIIGALSLGVRASSHH